MQSCFHPLFGILKCNCPVAKQTSEASCAEGTQGLGALSPHSLEEGAVAGQHHVDMLLDAFGVKR